MHAYSQDTCRCLVCSGTHGSAPIPSAASHAAYCTSSTYKQHATDCTDMQRHAMQARQQVHMVTPQPATIAHYKKPTLHAYYPQKYQTSALILLLMLCSEWCRHPSPWGGKACTCTAHRPMAATHAECMRNRCTEPHTHSRHKQAALHMLAGRNCCQAHTQIQAVARTARSRSHKTNKHWTSHPKTTCTPYK